MRDDLLIMAFSKQVSTNALLQLKSDNVNCFLHMVMLMLKYRPYYNGLFPACKVSSYKASIER